MTIIEYHPYGKEGIVVTFKAGSSLEFACLSVGGETRKYETQALSLGIIERLSAIQWLEGEENYFAIEVYGNLVNNNPMNRQVAYSINKAHLEDFPNAAEALSLLADFYQFQFDCHTLHYWADAVSVNSSLIEGYPG